MVDDRQVDQAGGADLLVELLERGVGLLLDPTGGRVGREPRVGQRGGQLVGGLVDGATHDRVGLQQPLAPGVELLDLLARLLATRREVAQARARGPPGPRPPSPCPATRAASSSCLGLLAHAVEVALTLVAERLGLLGRLGADQRRGFLRLGLRRSSSAARLGESDSCSAAASASRRSASRIASARVSDASRVASETIRSAAASALLRISPAASAPR